MGGNRALEVNPPNANINISRPGSNWLWALFSIFGLSLLVAVFFDRKVRILLMPPRPAT